mgnify:CR=1 FL=1
MVSIDIISFRKKIYEIIENTIEHNEPINIKTKKGNAVILSEMDYNNLMETLYISSVPNLKEEIIKRANDADADFIDALE